MYFALIYMCLDAMIYFTDELLYSKGFKRVVHETH